MRNIFPIGKGREGSIEPYSSLEISLCVLDTLKNVFFFFYEIGFQTRPNLIRFKLQVLYTHLEDQQPYSIVLLFMLESFSLLSDKRKTVMGMEAQLST